MSDEPVRTEADLDPDLLAPGLLIELRVGPVAHGGHCVARFGGRVVFVRLALPGETVVARVIEAKRGSFGRAEVVSVLDASADRVVAPCAHYGPGGCGGCDWQHASGVVQRELKATVVAEQLRRLAGVSVDVVVEPIGEEFGYRTRVRWALDTEGRIGPRRHRSHDAVAVSRRNPCLLAPERFSGLASVLEPPPPDAVRARGRRGRAVEPEVTLVHDLAVWSTQEAPEVVESALGREFRVAADGFWQVHPAAAAALAAAVRSALPDVPGGSAWDLYGGVGLFAAVLAHAVGESGSVLTVEGDRRASELAAVNLADLPQVSAVWAPVERFVGPVGPVNSVGSVIASGAVGSVGSVDASGSVGSVDASGSVGSVDASGAVDLIVLDPPRTGAGAALCSALAARAPRVIVYVACDPAALGRDTAALAAAGYRLDLLRAFDCFPQTHHVECVAAFLPV